MYTTIQKWGNSHAVRLPKAILEMTKIKENDKVEIKVQDGNLIISPVKNQFTKIGILCPITNTNRGFPLHVQLDERTKTSGVIMCEQVKSLDISAKNASFIEKTPKDIFDEVTDILIGFDQ